MTRPRYDFFGPSTPAQVPKGLTRFDVDLETTEGDMKTTTTTKEKTKRPRYSDADRQRYKAARLAGKSRAEAGREAGFRWSSSTVANVCGLKLDRQLGIADQCDNRPSNDGAQKLGDALRRVEDAIRSLIPLLERVKCE